MVWESTSMAEALRIPRGAFDSHVLGNAALDHLLEIGIERGPDFRIGGLVENAGDEMWREHCASFLGQGGEARAVARHPRGQTFLSWLERAVRDLGS